MILKSHFSAFFKAYETSTNQFYADSLSNSRDKVKKVGIYF